MIDIDKIKTIIKPIAKKYGVEKIILYGSRARGDFHKTSDYDLYIIPGQIKTLIQLAEFQNEIETAIKGKTDITTMLDKYLKAEIIKDGILLWIKD